MWNVNGKARHFKIVEIPKCVFVLPKILVVHYVSREKSDDVSYSKESYEILTKLFRLSLPSKVRKTTESETFARVTWCSFYEQQVWICHLLNVFVSPYLRTSQGSKYLGGFNELDPGIRPNEQNVFKTEFWNLKN